MLKNIRLVLLFVVLSAMANAQPKGFTAIADEAAFRKKFAEQSASIQTIKSDFIQEKNMNVLAEKIISKGEFCFKKQNKVRMEYTSPYKYLLVIDNDKVFVKDEQKINTFSSKSNLIFERINKIIIDCVQGTAMDNKDFSVKAYENENQYLLILTPLKKNFKELFANISIYIEKKDYSVYKMDMAEPAGDNTVITFVNKQFNVNIPDAVFSVK